MIFKILNNGTPLDEFCRDCGLWKKCKTARMAGEGSNHPKFLFVGEAPGESEDSEGKPFVGRAGLLLREEIQKVGIDLDRCRFTNTIRCRPPNNDITYRPEAIDYCRGHLLREIHATNPEIIVLLGNTAIGSVLNRKGILSLHGRILHQGKRHYLACLHPSYVLRNDNKKTREKFREALIAARLFVEGGKRQKTAKKRIHIFVRDKKQAQEIVDELKSRRRKGEPVIADIEGSTLSPFNKERKAEVGCVGFALDANTAAVFPGRKRVGMERYFRHLREEESFEAIKEIWENSDLVGHFCKYDYVYMAVVENIWGGAYRDSFDKEATGFYADTGLMSYCLDERKWGGQSKDLKDRAHHLGMGGYEREQEQWEQDHPECNPQRGGNKILSPAKILYAYNGDDCIADFRLFHKLLPQLKEKHLWHRPFRFPLMFHFWTSASMEIEGLNLDAKANQGLSESFSNRIEELDKRICNFPEVQRLQKEAELDLMEDCQKQIEESKQPIWNPKQRILEIYQQQVAKLEKKGESLLKLNTPETKRRIVYQELGYQPTVFTEKTKLPSTKGKVLEELQNQKKNKLLGLLIKRSQLESSKSKYIDPVIKDWAGTDGRTHTVYKPQGTLTGRVSSEQPNHENLPKRYKLAMELRTQFIARGPGYGLLELDQKQFELRLMSDRAKDRTMIAEFNAGKDPHRMGASAAFEVPEDKVTKEQRNDAKSAVSFGLVYGRKAPALADSFKKEVEWAERFINRYFGKYYGIAEYLKKCRTAILHDGIVFSNFGRPRRLPEVESEEDGKREAAVREGINSPIQGDASDVTWIAGFRLQKWLLHHKMLSRVVVIVHDALIIDFYLPELLMVLSKARKLMADREYFKEKTGWFCRVPWDSDASVGQNLGIMQELQAQERHGEKRFLIPEEWRN